MTTRLLARTAQASAPRTVREVLQAASLETVVRVGDVQVSGAALPLFRAVSTLRATDVLHQVVRLAFTSRPHRLDRVELCRSDGEPAVSWTGDLPPDGVLDLLVPEITEPATWTVVVVVDGHPHRGTLRVAPGRKLTVHLVHHSHLTFDDPELPVDDLDLSGGVLRYHWDALDAVVDLARDDARVEEREPETGFRFTVDASLPVRTWLRQRPSAVVEEFCRLVRAGVVDVTAMPFSLNPATASEDELVSVLRPAVALRERYRLPVRSVLHTGVLDGTSGFVDCLADAGVRYVAAVDGGEADLAGLVREHGPAGSGGRSGLVPGRLMWWRSPAGARLLTWASDAHLDGALLGLAESYDAAVVLLPLYLHAFAGPAYPFDLLQLGVRGHHAANAGPSLAPARIARRWNAEWAFPRLVCATTTSFLQHVERQLGDHVPGHLGDWGSPSPPAADARRRGYHRRSLGLARTAEAMHAFADLRSGASTPVHDQVDAIHERAGSFDAPGSGGWARCADAAEQAYDDACDLLHHGVRRLGAGIGRSPFSDVRATVAVYNTTGWTRTDVVRVFLPDARLGTRALGVVDTRRDERVPARVTPTSRTRRGCLVEFVAREVPPLGWVRFDLVGVGEGERSGGWSRTEDLDPRAGAGEPGGTAKAAYRLANDFYELTYDTARGLVSSVVDRRTGHELVNHAALTGLNEYIVDTYALNTSASPVPARTYDGTLLASRRLGRPAVVRAFESSELCDRLEVEVCAPEFHVVRTTIELYAGVPRVDITNRVRVQPGMARECGYFAFPLAGSGPLVYERTGAVVEHTGAPGPLAIRHWAGVRDQDYVRVWATLEAPNVQVGTLALPGPPYPTTIALDMREPSTLYSWVYDSCSWVYDSRGRPHPPDAVSSAGGVGCRGHPAEMTFRYAVAGAVGSSVPALGAATAAGLTDPLVAVLATGHREVPLVSSGSLLTVRPPEVTVAGLGRPRDGSAGIAVRLRSLASQAVEAEVTLEGIVAGSAVVTSALDGGPATELSVVDGRVRVPIPAGTLRTLLLRP
jgi:hypothetical protein